MESVGLCHLPEHRYKRLHTDQFRIGTFDKLRP